MYILINTPYIGGQTGEIHLAFLKGAGEMLHEAHAIVSREDSNVVKKGRRLAALGFTKTTDNRKADVEIKEKQASERTLLKASYYQGSYPNQTFITREKVNAICDRFNLVCDKACYYKGFVPERNLKEVEGFQLKDSDVPFMWHESSLKQPEVMNELEFRQYFKDRSDNIEEVVAHLKQYHYFPIKHGGNYSYNGGFQICVPKSEVDTGTESAESSSVILNPIVLYPVSGGFLLISSWGAETTDSI